MADLLWRIELSDGQVFTGRQEVTQGEVHIVCDLPERHIKSVRAEMLFPLTVEDRVFVNGFQSWTHCPEMGPRDFIRSLDHLPRAGVRHFGLDRYGDNYFVPYDERQGYCHGESYAYARRGEEFRLVASLDERPGYTLMGLDMGASLLTLERDCAGMWCGKGFHAFDLYFAQGSEKEVFDGWFAALGLPYRKRERLCGYSSWYNRYQDINEASIRSDLDACEGFLQPGDLFQIDDGWERAVGDWLGTDEKKFLNGLKHIVDDIHARGYRAGLWLAPYVAQKTSALAKEHPDWLYRTSEGSWYTGINWGGAWALDFDLPQVRDYLRRVFRQVFDEWGFDLVKLDFLYGAAPFGNALESRAGRMIRAMDFLRELCAGKLILGCGVPLMPAFGRVDYCRIGCDVGLDWDDNKLMQKIHRERVSTRQSLENTLYRRQLDGRAFGNDPDVFFLREENTKLTLEQKWMLAQADTLLGSVWLTSDDMGKYDESAAARFRELRELQKAENIRVELDQTPVIRFTLNGEERMVSVNT